MNIIQQLKINQKESKKVYTDISALVRDIGNDSIKTSIALNRVIGIKSHIKSFYDKIDELNQMNMDKIIEFLDLIPILLDQKESWES
jgi:hypothetical protein